jgi:hydrogenase nickel incorporation protein HypA/HybF
MHEVSVAQNILEIVIKQASLHKAEKVNSIKVVIGEFTGIAQEALEFALDSLKKETPASNAVIIFERVEVETICKNCSKSYSKEGRLFFQCPNCGGSLEIVRGKELYVENIGIE